MSEICYIKDLFEENFVDEFINFLETTSLNQISEMFYEARYAEIRDYYNKTGNDFIYIPFLDMVINFDNNKLSFDEFKKYIFNYHLKWLLYKVYKFLKRRNNKQCVEPLKILFEKFFSYDFESYYKKYFIEEFPGLNPSNKTCCFYVISDIFKGLEIVLCDKYIQKNLNNNIEQICHYAFKKTLNLQTDDDKVIENLLNQTIVQYEQSKKRYKKYSNIELAKKYNYYKEYVDILKNIDFDFDAEPDEKEIFLNNHGIDTSDDFNTFASWRMNSEDIKKRRTTLALDALEHYCAPININRATLRKRIERGNKELEKKEVRAKSKFERVDEKIKELYEKIYEPSYDENEQKIKVKNFLEFGESLRKKVEI